MPVLWLASYTTSEHHKYRIGAKRARKESLFGTALDDEKQELLRPSTQSRGGSRQILALLRVSEGFMYEGICTPWPAEAWRAHATLKHPCDAFTLHVRSCFRLNTPLEVAHTLDQGGQISNNPRLQQPIFLPLLPDGWRDSVGILHGQSHPQFLGEVLWHWSRPGLDDERQLLPALAMAAKDAEDVLEGRLSCLFCLGRWVRDISRSFHNIVGFPQVAWILGRGKAAEHEALDDTPLSAAMLAQLLQHVRLTLHNHALLGLEEEPVMLQESQQIPLCRFCALFFSSADGARTRSELDLKDPPQSLNKPQGCLASEQALPSFAG